MNIAAWGLAGLVGLAGATGALVRYLIGRLVAEKTTSTFPLGTLLINVSGAFLIGLLFALAGKHLISLQLQTVLATGFLGGYTTFSTMSWEGVQLARSKSVRQSVLYLGGNVALGLPAVVLGLALGGWLS